MNAKTKVNTLYIDFYRPMTFQSPEMTATHVPKVAVGKDYDLFVTYGVYTDSTSTTPIGSLVNAIGTVAIPKKMTVLEGAMWNTGVSLAGVVSLVAMTLY